MHVRNNHESSETSLGKKANIKMRLTDKNYNYCGEFKDFINNVKIALHLLFNPEQLCILHFLP